MKNNLRRVFKASKLFSFKTRRCLSLEVHAKLMGLEVDQEDRRDIKDVCQSGLSHRGDAWTALCVGGCGRKCGCLVVESKCRVEHVMGLFGYGRVLSESGKVQKVVKRSTLHHRLDIYLPERLSWHC